MTTKARALANLLSQGNLFADGQVQASEVTGLHTVATTGSYADLVNKPTVVSHFTNDANYASTTYVNTQMSSMVASAPATLDTLNELAAALGNDANFSTTTATALGNRLRVDTAAQSLSSTQKTNAKTNLDLQNVENKSSATIRGELTSANVTTALGFTPYNSTNPNAYISGNQTITFSGDATGSGAVTVALTLANSGVTAGTYGSSTNIPQLVVDAKGRVTSVSNVAVSIPSGALTFTGDVTGSGSTGSSTALTLANSGVTAGTYTKVTVDAKGRVTTGATLASADLPTYTGSLTSAQVTGALGFTPYNSTNPSGYITSSFTGFMLRSTSPQANPNTNFLSSAYRFDPNANNPTNEHYAVLTFGNESNVVGQVATHFVTGQMFTRGYNSTWSTWRTQLDSSNYTSYSPTLTGTGASGTWGISITGSAGSVAWTNVSGRPTAVSSFTNDSGYITNTGNARVGVENNGTLVGTRRNINFIPGTGVSLTITDDSANEEVDVTVTNTGVTSVSGTGTVSGLTLSGTVTTTGSLTLGGTLTLTSAQITSGLGYTPLSLAGGSLTGALTSSGSYTSTDNANVNGSNFVVNTTNKSVLLYAYDVQRSGSTVGGIRIDGSGIFASGTTIGGNVALHAGNYTSYSPTLTGSGASGTWGISITGNAATASQVGGYTSDGWLRKVGDSTQFQMYGNTRSMIYRTDGVTNPHGGGSYAHIFYYGGSSDNQRVFIVNTDGRLYSPYHGWLDTISTSGNAATASRVTSGNLTPASTSFNNALIPASGSNRVLTFDGNGSLPSVWWSNGTRAYGAIDAIDPGLAFWANNGSNWQRQITLNYGSVNIETVLQQGGNQVLHASNYSSYALPLTGGTVTGAVTAREFLPGLAGSTSSWNGTSMSYFWTRVANLSGSDGHATLLIHTKTDVNYVPYVAALLSLSKFNSTSISVKLDGLSSYDVGLSVRIDNNNDVWVRASADWSSYKTWSVISRYGSITIYTTGLSETLTTPANSVEISVGQQVRGNQGSIASASAQNNASHVFGAVSSRGAITENGNQVLHASNYSSYAVPLSGGTMSGRLTTTAWTTSARNYSNEWIEFPNYTGLYSPQNGAHFYPNNVTYGSWRIAGSRNNWHGLHFDSNSTLMMNSAVVGFHREGHGWQMRWDSGIGYISKGNPGGGTDAVILDAANYTSYTGGLSTTNNWTGVNYFRSNQNTTGSNPPLQAYSNDSGGAIMSFHRGGYYAVNMGLDSDNVFRIGGWSASANRLQMDMSGNLTMAGNVTAYSDERLKKDWLDLPNDFVERLAEVKNGTYTRTDEDMRQVGVSAQSLQDLLPEAVLEGEYLSVSYGNAALAACVELAKELVKLKQEILELKAQKNV